MTPLAGSDAGRIALCALLPHPPIAAPAVARRAGREEEEGCRRTTHACAELASRLIAAKPARLLLLSPHSPRSGAAFGLFGGEHLRGDLGAFGAAEVAVDLPADRELARELDVCSRAEGVETWSIPPAPLDHGAVVPLSFLVAAGWRGPTCVASLPEHARVDALAAFGRAVARAIGALPGDAALVASGDMSHRLRPGAPAGHHPRAVELDRAMVAAFERGRLERIPALDSGLRSLAAEDVVDTCAVAIAALPARTEATEVLSYEGPFGVGYLVAVLHAPGA